MTATENLQAFVEGGALWGQAQSLRGVADKLEALAVAIGQGVERKTYTLKTQAGAVIGNRTVMLRMTPHDNPAGVEEMSWDVPADGKTVVAVGCLVELDLFGFQQSSKNADNTNDEDWGLVENS